MCHRNPFTCGLIFSDCVGLFFWYMVLFVPILYPFHPTSLVEFLLFLTFPHIVHPCFFFPIFCWSCLFFFWFLIHTASETSTAETHTNGGTVIRKPWSACPLTTFFFDQFSFLDLMDLTFMIWFPTFFFCPIMFSFVIRVCYLMQVGCVLTLPWVVGNGPFHTDARWRKSIHQHWWKCFNTPIPH